MGLQEYIIKTSEEKAKEIAKELSKNTVCRVTYKEGAELPTFTINPGDTLYSMYGDRYEIAECLDRNSVPYECSETVNERITGSFMPSDEDIKRCWEDETIPVN